MAADGDTLTATVIFSVDDVVAGYMGAFFFAFIVCLVATPLMHLLAKRLKIVDIPNRESKLHHEPTAYLGGVAILLGWLAGVGSIGLLTPHTAGMPEAPGTLSFPLGVIIGAGILVIVGVIDDAKPLRARYKLLGQACAAAAVATQGIGMHILTGSLKAVGGVTGIDLLAIVPAPVLTFASVLLVVIFIVGACNATNFLDGADGLASGVTTVITLGLTCIAIFLATGIYQNSGPYSVTQDPVRMVLCLALLGTLLGFLPYNFKPANIFMGDAGSMLLGYLCIVLILSFGEKGDPLPVMAGLTVFALPILDTALAIIRRKVRRRSIAAPDSYHLHHLFMRAGLGVTRSVLMLYVLALGFAALGCAMMFFRLRYVSAVFITFFAFIAITAYKVAHRYYTDDGLGIRPTARATAPAEVESALPVAMRTLSEPAKTQVQNITIKQDQHPEPNADVPQDEAAPQHA